MKRLFAGLIILTLQVSFCYLWAQNDDIEVTDSTSTGWGGGNGGGINPQTPTGPVTTLTLSHATLTLAGGESARLTAKVNSDAANKTVLWSSADSNIASVSDNGQVYARGKGTTTITATAASNNNVKQTCTVTVTSNPLLPGDVDGNGRITIFDAVQVVNYILELSPANFSESAADMDGNGRITIFDAVSIVNSILGINTETDPQ